MIEGQQTERTAGPLRYVVPSRAGPGAGSRVAMSERDVEILRSLVERIDPNDAGGHNNLGVVFFQKGLIDDAIGAFTRALDLDSHLAVARRNAEIALVETGRHQRRVQELEEQLRVAPGDTAVRDSLARLHMLAGDPAAAALEWRRLLAEDPDSVALHLKLADAEAERGRPARALALLARASELSPTDPAVHLHTAELLERNGQHEQSEAAVRRALALDVDLVRGHALHGRILEALDRAEEARRAFDRVAALDPGALRSDGHLSLERYRSVTSARARREPITESTDDVLGRYARAVQLRKKGDLEGAARELERAGDQGVDGFEVRLALAEIRLLQGAFEEALDLYDRLIELRDDSPKTWNERGVAFHRLGHLDSAINSYRQAVALDHGYHLGWNNLGVARAQRGDGSAAARALRQAAGPTAPVEVLHNLSLHLVRSGAPEEAIEVSRGALSRDEASPQSWSRLGSAFFQAQLLPEARDALLQALELNPDYAEARYQLGFVLSSLGDFRGALRETKQALELDPVFPVPRFQLLIDVEYEDGLMAAPDRDAGERVLPGTAVPHFQFEPAALDRALDGLVPARASLTADRHDDLARAREALRRGQLRQAAALAAGAVAAAPLDPDALALQGTIFLQRGLAGEALERFDAALTTDPGHPESVLGRARALLELGRAPDAIVAAEGAARVQAPGAAVVLGRALLADGRVGRAVSVFENAVAADDGDLAARTGHGDALLAHGRPAEAEAAFRSVVDRSAGAVAARVGLAGALNAMGRIAPAEAEYREAVVTLPSYGPAVLGLADLLGRTGRGDEAVRVLVDFLALDPTDVDGLVRLGQALTEGHRRDHAASVLRRARRLDPDHEGARAALQRLDAGEGD
jgi:cellulose synthase operon protein C